jgi:uncharacterized membrane protein (DUF485 family)
LNGREPAAPVQDAEVDAIAGAHRRVALAVVGAIGVLYFGLILLIALDKPLLGRVVVPGLSLAILFGAVVTVAAWVLTLLYVRWANTHYDAAVRRLRR